MLYIGIKLPRIRRTVIAVLLLITAVLIYATSDRGAVKCLYTEPDERVAFLKACGYETEADFETDTVRIPQVFSEVYKQYNELQKDQGYDLTLFSGMTVTRYTYTVTNYPSDDTVLAHLLVYDGVIIGGDVMSTALDGFMLPLKGN